MTKYIYRNFLIVLAVDVFLVAFCWYFAHLLRFNFDIPPNTAAVMSHILPVVLLVKIITFYLFDLYKGMWRYTGIDDVINIIKASGVASLSLVALMVFTHRFEGLSRATFIIDWIVTLFFIAGYRVGIRVFFWFSVKDRASRMSSLGLFAFGNGKKHGVKKLLVLGAGDCGEKIFREIRDNPSLRYGVVGFLDDDRKKVGKQLHGVPVLGTTHELRRIAESVRADEALLAIPSASAAQMRALVERCKKSGIPFKTVPGMGELIDGKVTIRAIREVAYRDLLGREVVRLDEDRIGGYLKDSRVMVTGGGGSIGSELCRQICRFHPRSLVLYENAESPLYEIDIELKEVFPGISIVPVLGDIRNQSQLDKAFSAHRPQVVFHAAAYKHVPMMEIHPWKAVMNNILGTRNVIDISSRYGVSRFVLVSTDKAVRPTNVMGASKRVAELLTQNQNGWGLSRTKYITVRFGNVVGSVGSVVPLFKKQIEKGGPVTVTHPEVTRYFMTIPEACQLILQAGAMGEGGEIFILDMGTPVKIVDMARDLIRLSGFEPDVDIEIVFIGLRPGEKLYEELITEGEGVVPTTHEKIMVLRGKTCDQALLNGAVQTLSGLAQEQNETGIKAKLVQIVEDYQPAP